jgi:hypothetical protein
MSHHFDVKAVSCQSHYTNKWISVAVNGHGEELLFALRKSEVQMWADSYKIQTITVKN